MAVSHSRNKKGRRQRLQMEDAAFDPGLIHAIFKHIWTRKTLERGKNGGNGGMECKVGGGATSSSSKKNRTTSANSNALKLTCELLRIFISEAVQRSATIAEAEGITKIEATHLERVLPQLLLDF